MVGFIGRRRFSGKLAFLAIVFAVGPALGSLSAVRERSTPAEFYIRAAKKNLIANGRYLATTRSAPVVWEKGSFEKAAWERVPRISELDLQLTFEKTRDEKIFADPDRSHADLRRATWLYPDDGCFVRAVIAADTVQKLIGQKAAKIFAFGNLNVKTNNSPEGSVEWWYHVAAIAKVTSKNGDAFFVYDPAVSTKKPMEVTAWLKSMGDPNIEIAICSGDAYDPDSDCTIGERDPLARAYAEAPQYLNYEWNRLEELRRDPTRELGAFPPWQ